MIDMIQVICLYNKTNFTKVWSQNECHALVYYLADPGILYSLLSFYWCLDAAELRKLLSRNWIEGLLYAHDKIATRRMSPTSASASASHVGTGAHTLSVTDGTTDVLLERLRNYQEHGNIKIVRIEKTLEPLGATVKVCSVMIYGDWLKMWDLFLNDSTTLVSFYTINFPQLLSFLPRLEWSWLSWYCSCGKNNTRGNGRSKWSFARRRWNTWGQWSWIAW